MVSNKVSLGGRSLVIEPTGANKALGFQGKMEIPYGHITAVSVGMGILAQGAWRTGGTSIPGKQVGSYRGNHLKAYVNVAGNEQGLLLELHDEWKDQLVLGVENAAEYVEAIKAKLADPQSTAGSLENQAVESKATGQKFSNYRWLYWVIIVFALVLLVLTVLSLLKPSANFAPIIVGLVVLLTLLIVGAILFGHWSEKK